MFRQIEKPGCQATQQDTTTDFMKKIAEAAKHCGRSPLG
jgi:hypothetical protein